MKIGFVPVILAACAFVAMGAWGLAQTLSDSRDRPQSGLDEMNLTITGTDSVSHSFHVEIAKNGAQREIGMMFRKSVAPDGGMIFYFPRPFREVAFWMKNTLVPLDIIFIDADGVVENVQHGVPLSLDPLPSDGAASTVLEVAAGTADRLHIDKGAKVVAASLDAVGPTD